MAMATETTTSPGARNTSYAEAISKIGGSAVDLVKSEIALVRAEIKQTTKKLTQYGTLSAIGAGVVMLSALPFTAFLVIGLGHLLNERYWLSSLIVAIVFALAGGLLTYGSYKRLRRDADLPRTRMAIKQDARAVVQKVGSIRHATQGDIYEQDRLH
jgi:uncharacterized membrane protein YqjE